MSVVSQITIKYGSRSVGGSSSTYQLLGPYVLTKEFNTFRLTFEVLVSASTLGALKTASENLENDFRLRDKDLTITLGGSTWTYTSGEDLLNVHSSITKSGDSDVDYGVQRAYTCEVSAEFPADLPATALRDIEFNVSFDAGRRATLAMQGVYTADSGGTASANYLSAADAEATTFLGTITGTFEMTDEDYSYDRNNHICQFSRSYIELLANQSQSTLDHTDIKDHRMTFTDLSNHPGDSAENIYRTRRVVASYDCAVDVDQYTGKLKDLVDKTIFPHLKALFDVEFQPQVFTVEDHRYAYDETSKRVSITAQFLYQTKGGGDIIEISQTMAYREQRNLDLVPIHLDDEFAAEIYPGWSILDRIATRTVVVIGNESPKRRIGVTPEAGLAGPIKMPGKEKAAGPRVRSSGWNIISNTSQTNEKWHGDPNLQQIKMTVLTETVVERWHKAPKGGTSARR